jgi:hypothetical protein
MYLYRYITRNNGMPPAGKLLMARQHCVGFAAGAMPNLGLFFGCSPMTCHFCKLRLPTFNVSNGCSIVMVVPAWCAVGGLMVTLALFQRTSLSASTAIACYMLENSKVHIFQCALSATQ